MTGATNPAVTEPAPAKINLARHVRGKRSFGYHRIESLVVFTAYGEEVTVANAKSDSFVVSGPFGHVLDAGASNLVVRARDAVRQYAHENTTGEYDFAIARTGKRPPGMEGQVTDFFQWWNSSVARTRSANEPLVTNSVSLRLTKNLPVASGVGGGSSDAAATIRALNRFANLNLSMDEARKIALPLGADLPMCLTARPLIARGVGEQIERVALPELPMVLVNPGVPVATPHVFRTLASANNAPLPPLPAANTLDTLLQWLPSTRNDLQAPALAIAPQIAAARAALNASGAVFTRMSGSGATCFGIFRGQSDALSAAMAIRAAQPDWFVVATHTMA